MKIGCRSRPFNQLGCHQLPHRGGNGPGLDSGPGRYTGHKSGYESNIWTHGSGLGPKPGLEHYSGRVPGPVGPHPYLTPSCKLLEIKYFVPYLLGCTKDH
ncbi:hypothetical protein AMTRI_Chr05g71520 [Amborella trichopoda]